MQLLHCRARIAYEEQIDTPNVKFANDSGISNAGFGDGNPEIRINSWTFNFIYKTIMSYISTYLQDRCQNSTIGYEYQFANIFF